MSYSSVYDGDNKVLLLQGQDGQFRSLILNDNFLIVSGEPKVKYLVYRSMFIYEDGVIRVDSIQNDNHHFIKRLQSDGYIDPFYSEGRCSIFKFVKKFEGLNYTYIAFIDDLKASFSFNISDDGKGASETCAIFKKEMMPN